MNNMQSAQASEGHALLMERIEQRVRAESAAEIEMLRKQRDELLAALNKCRLELGHCSDQLESEGWITGCTVKDAMQSADSAIARVKGGK